MSEFPKKILKKVIKYKNTLPTGAELDLQTMGIKRE